MNTETEPQSAPAPNEGGPIVRDSWSALKRFTAARIALGRTGASLPTAQVLAFGLAHAQARDAIHSVLDVKRLAQTLENAGFLTLPVQSRAADRATYLARPDWGRRLDADSVVRIEKSRAALESTPASPPDLVFVISDGLSATAIERNLVPLLEALGPVLKGYRIAPLILATNARVALADEVGALFGARVAVSLIGERPGLSSPDSLGIYLTFAPRVGRNDSERNCISNVRDAGLRPAQAALQLGALIAAALAGGYSGIGPRGAALENKMR